MFKSFFQFLISKSFLKQLTIYVLLLCVSTWVLLWWLDVYTKHGEYVKVPDFKGISVNHLKDFSTKNHVTYLVVDSTFEANTPPEVVIKQEPEYNAEVKEGREVYLYISASLPPELPMPKFIDRSLRQAISMIGAFGFKLGKINFIKDDCVNCVLEQRIKGKGIKPGLIVSKGSTINLTVGKGKKETTVRIPCLYGLTKNDAIIRLAESSLAVNKTVFEGGKETPHAKVYKQIPSCQGKEDIDIGSTIDIFLTVREKIIPKVSVDTIDHTKSEEDNDFDK